VSEKVALPNNCIGNACPPTTLRLSLLAQAFTASENTRPRTLQQLRGGRNLTRSLSAGLSKCPRNDDPKCKPPQASPCQGERTILEPVRLFGLCVIVHPGSIANTGKVAARVGGDCARACEDTGRVRAPGSRRYRLRTETSPAWQAVRSYPAGPRAVPAQRRGNTGSQPARPTPSAQPFCF